MVFNIFIASLLFFSVLGSKSYSLADCHNVPLDKKLTGIMNYRNGTFVEVGAFDGVMQSNTKLLEEMYDWTGILIEPSENLFKTLCENRPKSLCYQCALGSFEQDNTYVWGDFNGVTMSSVNGSRLNRPADKQVLMRSLQSILDETGISHVNFFSLDTEGYELAILQGIDFKKTTFDYLLIEIYPDEYSGIVALLSANGYDMIENFSNYNVTDNPYWDGTHNDYLFKRVN